MRLFAFVIYLLDLFHCCCCCCFFIVIISFFLRFFFVYLLSTLLDLFITMEEEKTSWLYDKKESGRHDDDNTKWRKNFFNPSRCCGKWLLIYRSLHHTASIVLVDYLVLTIIIVKLSTVYVFVLECIHFFMVVHIGIEMLKHIFDRAWCEVQVNCLCAITKDLCHFKLYIAQYIYNVLALKRRNTRWKWMQSKTQKDIAHTHTNNVIR